MSDGRCHFLWQNNSGSCRLDDKDLLAQSAEKGFTYISDRDTFDSLNTDIGINLPLLDLFSSGVVFHVYCLTTAHVLFNRSSPSNPIFTRRNGSNCP